jgi:hypothetical protein
VIRNEHVPKGAPFDPVLIASLRTIISSRIWATQARA